MQLIHKNGELPRVIQFLHSGEKSFPDLFPELFSPPPLPLPWTASDSLIQACQIRDVVRHITTFSTLLTMGWARFWHDASGLQAGSLTCLNRSRKLFYKFEAVVLLKIWPTYANLGTLCMACSKNLYPLPFLTLHFCLWENFLPPHNCNMLPPNNH